MTTDHISSMNQPGVTDIVVATGNPGKLTELRELLGSSYNIVSAAELGSELPEETGTTFDQNAILKASSIASQTSKIAIADDSGLEVAALDGAPGVYSARYSGLFATDAANREKLLNVLGDVPANQRSARFVSVIAIAFAPNEVETVEGTCEGSITTLERGEGGFGYDSIFEITNGKTLAEISSEEKNTVSHRAHAMVLARQLLEARLGNANEAKGVTG